MNKTCTSKVKKGFICAMISSVILSFIAPASAEIIYAQGFANEIGSGSATNKPMSDYDWETYFGTGATTGSSSVRIYTTPTNAGIVNVNAATPYGENIIYGVYQVNAANIQFAFTALTLDRNNYEQITLQFDIRSGTAATHHFAVKIGDDWYVSAATYDSENIRFETHNLVLDTADLIALDFSTAPGARTLGLTTTTQNFAAIAGDITAVGFFVDPGAGSTYMRVDNFIVTAIPEPATLGLLVLSVVGIFGFRRIRKERA
ncbi:MAG: PEP-CTERM sorting domain-containing protein [Kiritimatiellales bacterium]